ncbi:methyl-accepting chemotaxis protein [bacterium]|nr:methyl-accepting chemotaxis protein [bacterium]
MFQNLKLKQKMLFMPAIATFFFVAVLMVSLFYNNRNERHTFEMGAGYSPAVELSRDLDLSLAGIQNSLQSAVLGLDEEQLETADAFRDSFIVLTDEGKQNPVLNANDLEQLAASLNTYYNHARTVSRRMIDGDMSGDMMAEVKIMTERYNAINNQLEQNIVKYRDAMSRAVKKSSVNNMASRWVIICLILVSIAVLVIFSLSLTNQIIRPVGKVVTIMKDVAQGEGDLTKRIEIAVHDEIGELASWFNVFIDKLHEIISQVKLNTEEVTAAVNTISNASAILATGAEEHNAQASEVSAGVEEMSSSIMQNSQNAGQTAKIAENAGTKARDGLNALKATGEGMNEIVTSTLSMEKIIGSLTERTLQVGEISTVIDKIADQTNLLALNAAVEAARAGDQGSGFAVVADEVRKLAERTATATQEIATTIRAIQEDTISASKSMKESVTAVDSGKTALESSEQIFTDIYEAVATSVDMIQQIAAASEEQSAGAEEISGNVEEMNAVARQTAEAAEEMSAASQQLSAQTEILQNVVNQFKLKEHL